MPDDQDDSQKTEDPTQKRINDAVKKGQVAFSREVSNFLLLLVFGVSLVWFAPFIFKNLAQDMRHYLDFSFFNPQLDNLYIQEIAWESVLSTIKVVMLPFMFLIAAAFLSSFIQNGFLLSTEPITPKLEKISVLKGLKRLFSMKSLVEFLKGIVKISIVGVVGFLAVYPDISLITQLHDHTTMDILSVLTLLVMRLMVGVCAVMVVIAILDYLYQKYEYIKGLKMSKKDIKDEMKQTEGNPEIKSKLRSLRMERAKQRMMQSVPTSDVVITNPTHFAVALKYDQDTMAAPLLVAKGADAVAARIRDLAKENNVPIVRNPPVARALFDSVEIEETIPEEHFKAVAEIIAFVYKKKGKG